MITVQDIMMLVARVIVLFVAFPLHEFSHAFVANKLGDPTAKNLGRLDLNPLAHMQPLPTLGMMVLATLLDILTHRYMLGNMVLLLTSIFFFRAVPINPMYFKNRKGGTALTALAGPFSNVLLGAAALLLYKIFLLFAPASEFTVVLSLLFSSLISINLQLAAFNLLPIPPLDGSKVLAFFLSDRITYRIARYTNYIMIAMIILLYATPVLDVVINFIYRILYYVIDFLTGFVDLIAQLF
jgi:Zn-dependent protease